MRRFEDLTEEEQTEAVDRCLIGLVEAVIEGALRFNDKLNGDALQARIDKAMKQAEKMQTPWFTGEYVLEAARDELRSMACADAEDAYYPEATEKVVRL